MKLSVTIPVAASPDEIWPYLVNYEQRRLWETDLESLQYDSPVALGTTGTMKLADMPAMAFTLVQATPGHVIADQVATPDGGRLTFTHTITVSDGTTWLTQEVSLDKPEYEVTDLEFLCGVFADTPQAAWRLKEVVENAAPRDETRNG